MLGCAHRRNNGLRSSVDYSLDGHTNCRGANLFGRYIEFMSVTRVDIGTLTAAERQELMEASRVQGKPFVKHLHAFRGFAILNIVGAHAWSGQVYLFGGTDPSTGVTVLSAVSETLFHDSTVCFALISGLLFSLVLQSRGWSAFWSNKLANVISPYVVMTLLFTWYGHDENYRLSAFEGNGADYIAAVSENLWTGGASRGARLGNVRECCWAPRCVASLCSIAV